MMKLTRYIALIAGIAGASTLVFADTTAQPPMPPSHGQSTVPVPSLSQLDTVAIGLADDTMRTFIEGVRHKDLRVLGSIASLNFRKIYTPDQVNETFKEFFAVEITGDPLAGLSPIFFSAPAIGKDKRLGIHGMYELPDGLLLFQFAFVREGSSWKLDGINVRSQPYNPPAAKSATGKPLKFKIPAGKLIDA